MKKLLLIVMASLLLMSCKNDKDKTQDFVDMYNRSSGMIVNNKIKSTKATTSNPDQVDISVETEYEGSGMESDLVTSALPDLIGQAIRSEKLGKELFDRGVKFNLKVYGLNSKVILDKTIDNKNLPKDVDFKSIAAGEKPSNQQLNSILESFNKNLPIEDPSTGTKITSIKADAENNLVYTCEVPDSFKTALAIPGTEEAMKEAMLKSGQIKQVFSQTSVLGINHIKYLYTDKSGKVLKEITITKEEAM
ncbi:hypothetical protein PGH12_18210 [Chryseobacterium wangxinyae]|uniref:hypothetical protein n=1 Tax=Chryseobacterium sp. CY350 TaxID=2997336 RepID=UPI00226FA884|nr:hypothetical protein [Chryseobacterium sp. CY350]MCY0977612.1 hypothetical protein [Chryseobacterium sp. CY350]WBZ95379.1 hypothetical protein PGH12_18210 [Chryseobacterium sp. CY350]